MSFLFSTGVQHETSNRLATQTQDEMRAYWDKLSAGATVTVPLQAAQWSPLFGILKDRFGTNWTLSVAPA